MTSVLFVPNPHVRFDRPWGTPYVPLELLSVMAVAEAHLARPALFDVNWLIEEGRLQIGVDMWQRSAALAASHAPALVVMETWTGTLHHTVLFARALRALPASPPVIFLGAGTSAIAEEVLVRVPEVDGVIRGEGEPAMAVLCASLTAGALARRLPAAPGLVRRTDHGIEGAELAWVEDLDGLPRPAFHLAPLRPGDSIPLEPGRGCDTGCSFCALAGHWTKRYRPRQPESLAREMRDMGRRYPGSVLDLSQDVRFFSDPSRVSALCQHLGDRPPRWTCHARVDQISKAELATMASAGCCGILFGIETGCPAMQARIGKNVNLARLAPTLAAAKRLAIETRATFMVGYPEEDSAAMASTARTLLEARRAGAVDTPVNVLRSPPGSRLFADHADHLAFEPLLCVASAADHEARALIAADARLYSASYRIPGRLPWQQMLAGWLVLSLFAEPLAALVRHGASLDDLLASITVAGDDEDVEQVGSTLARQIQAWARRTCFLDVVALEDLLAYHLAVASVSRAGTSDPAPLDAAWLDRWSARPQHMLPYARSPWRLVLSRTALDRLLHGDLTPDRHRAVHRLVVAKIGTAGAPSYYTRRSCTVETFTVDETAAQVLRLCDGERSVTAIAQALAGKEPVGRVARICVEVVRGFVAGGVLGCRETIAAGKPA